MYNLFRYNHVVLIGIIGLNWPNIMRPNWPNIMRV